MNVGLIINPLSGRNGSKGKRLRSLLDGSAVDIAVLDNFSDLAAILRRMGERKPDVLAISAGDGTIHAVQTELAERRPFDQLPKLMLLPHGTANMSASDLGLCRSIEDVAQLLQQPTQLSRLPVTVRPTLRVANPQDGRPRHGMFLGTGAVYAATAYCQDILHRSGLAGNPAIVATLLKSVFDALSSRGTGLRDPGIVRNYDLRVVADGVECFSPGGLLFLATTLDRLVLRSRPFWGDKTGPIRATGFPFPVKSILRWIWPALYGSEHRIMPIGAKSFCGQKLEIWGTTPYVMDGEFFNPPYEGPLCIETGPDFAYIRG